MTADNCPKCKRKPRIWQGRLSGTWYVECGQAQCPDYVESKTEAGAIERWNERIYE